MPLKQSPCRHRITVCEHRVRSIAPALAPQGAHIVLWMMLVTSGAAHREAASHHVRISAFCTRTLANKRKHGMGENVRDAFSQGHVHMPNKTAAPWQQTLGNHRDKLCKNASAHRQTAHCNCGTIYVWAWAVQIADITCWLAMDCLAATARRASYPGLNHFTCHSIACHL